MYLVLGGCNYLQNNFLEKKVLFLTQGVNCKQFYTKNQGVKIEKKTDFTAILAAIFTFFLSKTYKQ